MVGDIRPNEAVVGSFAVPPSLDISRYLPNVLRKPTHLGCLSSIPTGSLSLLPTQTSEGPRPGPYLHPNLNLPTRSHVFHPPPPMTPALQPFALTLTQWINNDIPPLLPRSPYRRLVNLLTPLTVLISPGLFLKSGSGPLLRTQARTKRVLLVIGPLHVKAHSP